MLNFLTIVLIILLLVFLIIYKRKYIFNAFQKKKLYPIEEIENFNINKTITSSAKNNNIHYQSIFNKNSEFEKRILRGKMSKLFQGNTADKLQALNIAEELADKTTLPILRRGLKDMNLKIVERSANLIKKFK